MKKKILSIILVACMVAGMAVGCGSKSEGSDKDVYKRQAVYKMDYGKVLQYHIDKKVDVTVVCKEMDPSDDVSRFGTIRMDDDMRITEFEEKPMVTKSNMISTGIYVIRRRLDVYKRQHLG